MPVGELLRSCCCGARGGGKREEGGGRREEGGREEGGVRERRPHQWQVITMTQMSVGAQDGMLVKGLGMGSVGQQK